MERSSCRLYSGPLSVAAQKILDALQTQRRHVARQNHRYSRTHHISENRQNGSQWEPWSQSYMTQVERKDHSQWQDSQILDFSQSSQASSCSSYWDPLLQRQLTPACYQRSHMYSHRRDSELAAFQSSQSLSFTQCETATSQKDRYTLALQTPQRLSEHQVTAWRNSEEIVPQFTINLSLEDPYDTVPQRHLQDSTSYSQESSYQDGTAQPHKQIRLHLAQEKQMEYGLYLTNQMSVKEFEFPCDISETGEGKQEVYATGNNSKPVDMEEVLPHDNGDLVPDKVGECKPALIENEVNKENPTPFEHCAVIKTSDIRSTKCPLMQSDSSKLVQFDPAPEKATTRESTDFMDVELEVAEKESKAEIKMVEGKEEQLEFCLDAKLRDKQQDREKNTYKEDVSSEDKKLETAAVERKSVQLEDLRKSCLTPVKSQEFSESVSTLTNSTHAHHDKAPHGTILDHNVDTVVVPAVTSSTKSSPSPDSISSYKEQNEHFNILPLQSPLKPSFTLKRKYEAPQLQSVTSGSSNSGTARRPPKWEPPRSSQEHKGEERKVKILQERSEKCIEQLKKVPSSADCIAPKKPRCGPDHSKPVPETLLPAPNHNHTEHRNQSKPGSLTSSLASDPRVTDVSKMSQDEMELFLKKAQQSEALVLTMVFRDGTTQLDPEQKLTLPVCGLLVLIKNDLNQSTSKETLGPNDSLVYLKLDHAPAWAQQPTHPLQELFTRDLLLHVFSSCRLVVCYKAKDLLRVVLQHYKRELTWTQVVDCQIQDPQVSGWLLDPADPASCFQDLLNKHCQKPYTTPALGTKKVSQIIAGLYSLYKLNGVLSSKLQSQGLWRLYSDMELKMIPVLAAMESCCIHVDKEALRRTSDLLGTKMKQLEQEAHKAAGQMFLLTSSTQLRTVLFEKLHLHKRCENKKLPKTINKQQSTSEAALLQLQDLHPLPKIILEYRQVHKIKSTFVDGILSCMMTKNYISSTWYQTSVVTGRISAKHPNFQALPRQPLQVTRKQYIPGKAEEVVTVHPRAMFIPKDGWTFLSADFCQVELRLLAHLCADPELLRIFTNPKADVFCMLASQWKGVSETEVTSEDREHAKRIVYSVVYGAGPERLSGILGVSSEQARRFQDSFLQTYKEVQTFIQRTVTECQKKGYVLSIMGRRRTLPNINSPDWSVRMQAERQAVNFVVQGSAADLCKMAMIRIFNLLSTSNAVSARLIAQLHDELLYEVEDSQVEQFAAVVKSTMESLQHIDQFNVHLTVPLKVAVSSGKSWGSMSELNVPPS